MAKKVKLTKQQKWELQNQEFVNSVVGLSVGDLNVKLSTLSKNQEEVRESLEAAMEDGEPLKEALNEVAQLKGPFSDAKKLLKQKSSYVYQLLKEKGGK
jgi:hypothetical protein